MTEIKISMQISVDDPDLRSGILITVDDVTIEAVRLGPQSFKACWQGALCHGNHDIAIHHLHDADRSRSSNFGMSVDYLRFQNVDHDFSSLGQIQHNTDALQWILQFQVPIYRWMHQKMNLGWLI
jgi:hypothetical protein